MMSALDNGVVFRYHAAVDMRIIKNGGIVAKHDVNNESHHGVYEDIAGA